MSSQNEEENKSRLRKNKKKMIEIWGKDEENGTLPTRDGEAGYGLDVIETCNINQKHGKL